MHLAIPSGLITECLSVEQDGGFVAITHAFDADDLPALCDRLLLSVPMAQELHAMLGALPDAAPETQMVLALS